MTWKRFVRWARVPTNRGDVAGNKAEDAVPSMSERTKVDMKRSGKEWKVVVTDKLYRLLTGGKK